MPIVTQLLEFNVKVFVVVIKTDSNFMVRLELKISKFLELENSNYL